MSGTGPVICERIVQDWGQPTQRMAVRSYDIRLDCGLAPCQSLTASSTFAMRYERGVHGGELRRQLVIVAESGSEAWRVAGAEARQRTVACVAVQHITSHWTVAGSRNG